MEARSLLKVCLTEAELHTAACETEETKGGGGGGSVCVCVCVCACGEGWGGNAKLAIAAQLNPPPSQVLAPPSTQTQQSTSF